MTGVFYIFLLGGDWGIFKIFIVAGWYIMKVNCNEFFGNFSTILANFGAFLQQFEENLRNFSNFPSIFNP